MENNGGLLEFIKTPEGQGLLATVFGGLAGAQRGQPLNSIGRAGMSGLTGYGNALDRQASMKKDNTLVNVAPGGTLFNPRTNQPVYSAPLAPKEPKDADPNKPFTLGPNGEFLPNKPYQDYETNKARAGASNVSVNTDQKGLDNELKFSAAFKSEPIYKAHQDVQSAYGQITQALNLKSPAGDLAGATKLMKILDPGSVVRESELAMAMSASGALDRLTNYGNMVVTGQKLTPAQRADFQNVADELNNESVKQYNAKREEYGTFASGYGLNSDVLLGKPAQNRQPGKPIDATKVNTPPAQTFDARPPAQQFKGKFVTSPDGKRYQSDGMTWKEVK